MRLTVYSMILFFVCLNLSLFLLNDQNVIGSAEYEPYEDIDTLGGKIFDATPSIESILIGGGAFTVTTIIGLVAGNLIYGAGVGLVLAALNIFFPMIRWAFNGFPLFLAQIGTPTIIVTVVSIGMSLAWAWFILGILVGRDLRT